MSDSRIQLRNMRNSKIIEEIKFLEWTLAKDYSDLEKHRPFLTDELIAMVISLNKDNTLAREERIRKIKSFLLIC